MSIPYILHVHVIPKSAKNQVIGWEKDPAGDRWLKIRVAAQPEDGKANKELVKFLAKALGVAPKQVKITGGLASRYKKLKIEGDLNLEELGLPAVTRASA
jgi:uncharacterized protein